MDSVLRLQVVRGIERPIHVNGVLTNRVQADAFTRCGLRWSEKLVRSVAKSDARRPRTSTGLTTHHDAVDRLSRGRKNDAAQDRLNLVIAHNNDEWPPLVLRPHHPSKDVGHKTLSSVQPNQRPHLPRL
jgi:hypothetical protein